MKHLRLILKSWLAGWRYETAWRVLLSRLAELYSILKARLFSRALLFHAPVKRLLPERLWKFLSKMNLIGHLRNKSVLTNVIEGNHFSIKALIRIWTNYNYEKPWMSLSSSCKNARSTSFWTCVSYIFCVLHFFLSLKYLCTSLLLLFYPRENCNLIKGRGISFIISCPSPFLLSDI